LFLARLESAWLEAQEHLESGEVIETEVSGFNKGGLVVPFGNLRGFVPASHVVGLPRRMGEDERSRRLAEQVGREIRVQVIEVDRKRKRLVMSEKSAVRAWREQQRDHLLDTLSEGQVIKGVVRSLANFGAFVDLGGVDGLVHISELSWQQVRHPSQVVRVGDEIDVYVLNLNKEEGKIGLSLRRLNPDPWSTVDTLYHVGQRVEGTVTNVVDFGAFVRLEAGLEGLVHVSEISDEAVNHPGEVLSKEQRCLLEIIKIDPDRRRVGLSLKRIPVQEQVSWANANGATPAIPVDVYVPVSDVAEEVGNLPSGADAAED
jgi:small subunit ribosomal protein S1